MLKDYVPDGWVMNSQLKGEQKVVVQDYLSSNVFSAKKLEVRLNLWKHISQNAELRIPAPQPTCIPVLGIFPKLELNKHTHSARCLVWM